MTTPEIDYAALEARLRAAEVERDNYKRAAEDWSARAQKKYTEVQQRHQQDLNDLHVALNAHQATIANLRGLLAEALAHMEETEKYWPSSAPGLCAKIREVMSVEQI